MRIYLTDKYLKSKPKNMVFKFLLDVPYRQRNKVLKMDGFDHCIIAAFQDVKENWKFLYSYEKVIHTLIKQGMTPEDAREYFEFNILGAYMGPHTPDFVDTTEREDIA